MNKEDAFSYGETNIFQQVVEFTSMGKWSKVGWY